MNKTLLALSTALTVLAGSYAIAQEATTTQTESKQNCVTGTDGKVTCADATTTTGTVTKAPDQVPATGASAGLTVPSDMLTGKAVLSANDLIGKRVYASTGEDIGEVNDLILTNDGTVRAAILGVGGFLGMGEKDVAVPLNSIKVTPDGENNVKLQVEATKESLEAAPAYDKTIRGYAG